MSEPTKIRLTAVSIIIFSAIFSPLFFIAAGAYHKFFTDRTSSQDTFLWGMKAMVATYIDVWGGLWQEIKYGVKVLDEDA